MFYRYPKSGNKLDLYEKYASKLLPDDDTKCGRNVKSTDLSLTNAIYRDYNIPMLTEKVSCCEYPFVGDLPYIWRQSLQPLMTVLNFTTTGLEGYVRDANASPMRNATIKLIGSDRNFDVTKNLAHFKIMLPPGKYKIEVSCHFYINTTINVDIIEGKMTFINVILTKAGIFESIIGTGIRGYVKDNLNHPISNALIDIIEANVTVLSDSNGKYSVSVPPGTYSIDVSANGYYKNTKYLTIDSVNPQLVMFTLVKDSNVWGMPRLVFVIFMGFMCFLGVGIIGACYIACRKKNDYGLLSQNGFYEDFKDFDESKETELFARPFKGLLL